jgi:Domain of Unknown Function (DUF928)
MKIESIAVPTSARGALLSFVFGFSLGSGSSLLAQTQTAPPPQPLPANKPPARVRTKMDGFELSPKSGKSPNQAGGASRELGPPKLFAPNSGKAFTTVPEFHWAAAGPGEKVTFRLSTAEGQTVYETATTADHLLYPSDAPTLTPGSSYRWTVVPENDLLGGAPPPATFLIVDGEERDQIAKETSAAKDASAVGSVFVKHRVWYDSIQAYSNLIERMPGDEKVRAARAELYDQLPVTYSLADADWRMVH